jgi:predicted lipid-binding transport protein (Tim44 family)
MKLLGKRYIFIWLLFAFSALLFVFDNTADARRLGGGRSFGSKPSYQRSTPSPSQSNLDRGQAQQGQRAQPQATATGRFGGIGGMFGGLLMGGLIGSLLFGGAGAMGGPGILDLILIGGILFFVVKLLRSRRNPAPQQAGQMPYGTSENSTFGAYDRVRGRAEEADLKTVLPAGFDVDEFLKGAKAAYNRLQASWSRRDLEDISQFASPAVMNELKEQARLDPEPSPVEILLVDATLVDVKDAGDERVASVLLDVTMREEQGKDEPSQVKEIWHFRRSISDKSSFWVLDGIQQVE